MVEINNCEVETGYICTGGTPTTPDTWDYWWGDGLLYGPEIWDDGNNNSDDGCSSDWSSYEVGFNWTPGNSTYQTMWTPIWGDGMKVGTEQWEDGNTNNKDGWSKYCSLEIGFEWLGGDHSGPDTWRYIWGDGYRVGDEKCDDNNTLDGDGWSADWLTVEHGYHCRGGNSKFKTLSFLVKMSDSSTRIK